MPSMAASCPVPRYPCGAAVIIRTFPPANSDNYKYGKRKEHIANPEQRVYIAARVRGRHPRRSQTGCVRPPLHPRRWIVCVSAPASLVIVRVSASCRLRERAPPRCPQAAVASSYVCTVAHVPRPRVVALPACSCVVVCRVRVAVRVVVCVAPRCRPQVRCKRSPLAAPML